MNNRILNWKYIFTMEKKKVLDILFRVSQERMIHTIYPPRNEIFYAFRLTPFQLIKVVIVGQDPYYKFNQANGLAFSVHSDCIIPHSLKNIYKELINDLKLPEHYYKNGCLENWAKQGVFLLNSVLTVECNKPRSHYKLGWQKFTDCIIDYINTYLSKVIFILWGKDAQQKKNIINSRKHFILCAPHPSPLSAHLGFFGCRHFSKINRILFNQRKQIINW